MFIFVVLKKTELLISKTSTIMDILLQYLNIGRQKQQLVKITDVPCNSIYQSIHYTFGINMDEIAISLIDRLEQTYRSNFLLAGIIDSKYCNRTVLMTLPYADFIQLTSGPGGASGIA